MTNEKFYTRRIQLFLFHLFLNIEIENDFLFLSTATKFQMLQKIKTPTHNSQSWLQSKRTSCVSACNRAQHKIIEEVVVFSNQHDSLEIAVILSFRYTNCQLSVSIYVLLICIKPFCLLSFVLLEVKMQFEKLDRAVLIIDGKISAGLRTSVFILSAVSIYSFFHA